MLESTEVRQAVVTDLGRGRKAFRSTALMALRWRQSPEIGGNLEI